jgi:5-methylcytosine-specific restriction endonuclease McrA
MKPDLPTTAAHPDETAPRRRLTTVERRALLERQDFRCAVCPAPLTLEVEERIVLAAMVDEHIIPLALGGSNDLANRELRCPACAKAKTAKDLKAIFKVKRIQRRERGEEPAKQKIRSRGFPRDPLSWRNAGRAE